MPRVKIDYVVSFSSEDPLHPASNLLIREVGKKKWLCKKGESSCSVVLQLPRTVKITGVHIGAYHAALVEVLVGRSETSSEQFQVLVPSSVFLTREESRRDAAVTRVRSFAGDALSSPARDQRWDRVRLVCSQPHNKHCQFGLSFVHIDEAEGASAAALPPRLLTLDTFSSDEDDFKPGELFAKHLQNTSGEVQAHISSNTGTQIRQATSQALKNINEETTKLVKTPISKPNAKRAGSPATQRSDHTRDTARHTRDEQTRGRDHTEISKHEGANKLNNTNQKSKDDPKTKVESNLKNESKIKDEPKRTPKRNKTESPPRPQNYNKPTSDQNKDKDVRKRRRSDSQERPAKQERRDAAELAPGPVSSTPHSLLRGAVMVLSGYQHPRRGAVRDIALALGARLRPDWGPDCTHLICAFPNTPKLRAVRATNATVPVAKAEWLENMSRRRRLLPWQWYATEQKHLVQPKPEQLLDDDDERPAAAQTPREPDSDGDTDDEIEKVLRDQKRRRTNEPNASSDVRQHDDDRPAATASDKPRTATCDTDDEVPTDEEAPGPPSPGTAGGALPDFLSGATFAIDAAPHDARQLTRYVRAYGGLALQMSELGEGDEVDYIVRGSSVSCADARNEPIERNARVVSAAWLARCHEAKARVPH